MFNCWERAVGNWENHFCWAKGWEIIASNPERNKPQTLSLSVNFEPKFETIFEMKFWKKFENFQNQEDISEKGWSILKYFEGFVQPILPYMKPLIRFLSEGMEPVDGGTWNKNWTIWFRFWTSVMVKIISKPEIEVIWGWFQIRRCWTGFFKIFKNISMT